MEQENKMNKETIKKLTNKVKKRYPSVYNVLIKERNEIMAKNLAHLMYQEEGNIVAVFNPARTAIWLHHRQKCN